LDRELRNSSLQMPALMEMGGAKSAKVVFLARCRDDPAGRLY